ncbi:MAG: hypothetical protein AVDCRST_MAG64-1923, partial [uncultured Phycisphaerae bacterium]
MGAWSSPCWPPFGARLLVVVLLTFVLPATIASAQDADLGPRRAPGQARPLSRVGELLEWLHREQQADGGWSHRGRLPLPAHVHARPEATQTRDSVVPDTAMAGLAMARAGNTVRRGDYNADVRRAADFLYRKVLGSGAGPAVEPLPTPPGVRIGPHADSFFALLFFLEVAGPGEAGAERY